VDTAINKKNKREEVIDALRGFALMGLFFVHMVEYFELYWFKPEASIYNDISFFLFGGKAYAIFALLFGLNFFIIMDNQNKNGNDFRKRFAWRVTLLFIAGSLHGLLYGGDILLILAITGFILIPLFTLPNYILLLLAGFFLLQIPAIIHIITVVVKDTGTDFIPMHWNLYGEVHSSYALGSFAEVIKLNFLKGQFAKWTFMLESGRLATILGISIFGFWIGRTGLWKKTKTYHNKIGILFILFSIMATILYFVAPSLYSVVNIEYIWLSHTIVNSLSDLLYTFLLVLGFIYLYNKNIFRLILKPLVSPGRMSLTIYVLQSIIFVPIFYGFGLGAYDYLGQTWSFYLGIFFWIIQIIAANYWIKNYYYGPLEWLWRTATFMNKDIRYKKY
jgi:uncharacterized protein